MKIKDFFLKKRILSLIIFVLYGFVVSYFTMSEYEKSQKYLSNILEIWESEIGKSIANSDYLFVSKIATSFDKSMFKYLHIFSNETSIYTYPNELKTNCGDPYVRDLTHYGQKVGVIESCLDKSKIVLNIITSRQMIFANVLLIIFAFFVSYIPLVRYKKSLLSFLFCLEDWASIKESILPIDSDKVEDELSNKMKELVRRIVLQQRSAQEELVLLQKTKEFSEIATQVAHDIRGPLAALNFALKSKNDEKKNEVLKIAADRINQIANSLLNSYSKKSIQPLTDELPLVHCSRCNITELLVCVENIILEKKCTFESENWILLQKDIRFEDLENVCEIDLSKFGRILSNIIENSIQAIKFIPQIIVNVEIKNNFLELTISDNGEGISKEVIPHLFQKGATFNKDNGTGVGLYFAKSYLQSIQGNIRLQSEIKVGTKVLISIPLIKSNFN
jgi:signal transduction histidine kinase